MMKLHGMEKIQSQIFSQDKIISSDLNNIYNKLVPPLTLFTPIVIKLECGKTNNIL